MANCIGASHSIRVMTKTNDVTTGREGIRLLFINNHDGRVAAVLPTGSGSHDHRIDRKCVGELEWAVVAHASIIDLPFSMWRAVTLYANLTKRLSIERVSPSLSLSCAFFWFPLVKSHVLYAFSTLFDCQNVFIIRYFYVFRL